MLTHLDDSPWHQLPTTFDHVGTSDPRFFDRLWFAASDRAGGGALQFTMGVYQNMNVVDGGFVVIADGGQHNLRVVPAAAPALRVRDCGPLAIDVREPMQAHRAHRRTERQRHLRRAGVDRAAIPPQEERPHFARLSGRILEDYSRYDQIGTCQGWLERRRASGIEVDRWWSCRDHSWGVRERVGIPEPVTGRLSPPSGGVCSRSCSTRPDILAGHVQVTRRAAGCSH